MTSEVFIPTYLYIKHHLVTGKLYFGKTIKNPDGNYKGGGKHWKSHIKVHGRQNVVTLWSHLFTDKDELVKFALEFSEKMNIVESDQWLNLIPEDGLNGGARPQSEESKLKKSLKFKGRKLSNEHKIKISESKKGIDTLTAEQRERLNLINTGKKLTEEHKIKIGLSSIGRKPRLGMIASNETKRKMSESRKGKIQRIVSCPHCGKSGGAATMPRWHFENCKFNK